MCASKREFSHENIAWIPRTARQSQSATLFVPPKVPHASSPAMHVLMRPISAQTEAQGGPHAPHTQQYLFHSSHNHPGAPSCDCPPLHRPRMPGGALPAPWACSDDDHDCATEALFCLSQQSRGGAWKPSECACRVCIPALFAKCLRVKLLGCGVGCAFGFVIRACRSV